jgi:hypothetical protein
MDVLTFETCWALNNEIIKQVTSVGLALFNYQDDARSNKHAIQDLFRLILVHDHTSVCCLTLPQFPCICQSAVEQTLCHVSSRTFLLPILGTPLWCVPLSHKIVYSVRISHLFLFLISLSHDIWSVMPNLVLLLFHFLLSDLHSTATELVFFIIKLPVLTSDTLAMNCFAFPLFLWGLS